MTMTFDQLCTVTAGHYVYCQCGQILQTREQLFEHWQRGHFDFKSSEEN